MAGKVSVRHAGNERLDEDKHSGRCNGRLSSQKEGAQAERVETMFPSKLPFRGLGMNYFRARSIRQVGVHKPAVVPKG
jgi:hypothetical protein